MFWHLAFALLFLAIFIALWFAFIRPTLAKYRATAGITAQLDAGEHSAGTWLGLQLKGLKSVALMLVTSFFTGAYGLVQSLFGLDPTALAPFQDSTLWKEIVGQEVALKAAAVAMFAAAILTLHGKLKDVMTVPQAQPVIVPPQGSAVPPPAAGAQ